MKVAEDEKTGSEKLVRRANSFKKWTAVVRYRIMKAHVLRAPRWPTHHEADVGSAARRGQCGQPTDAWTWTEAYVRLFDGLFSASRPCVYSWMSDADVARLGFRGVDTAGGRRLEGARSASVRCGLLEVCSCGTDRQVLRTYQQDIVSCKHIPEL